MIDFRTDDDAVISIEAVPVRRTGAQPVSRGGTVTGDRRLDAVVSRVRQVAAAVSRELGSFDPREFGPTKTEIEFGVSVSTEADVFVVRGAAESSFKVKMTWEHGGTGA
ncbi:CU044_2847 family protein [Nocardiopsis sp. NPDC006938]|uniref:CU044_2847 family protein n=1 Tax=Nocardiopsis sp. NPDC006938 TaxID=3364337 RepID=UPI0036ACB7FF